MNRTVIRWLLCQLIGGGLGSPARHPPGHNLAFTVHGHIVSDAFVFSLPLVGPLGREAPFFILDTGAFEMLLPPDLASRLGLPNLGPLPIGGIGGSVKAYQSQVDILLSPRRFPAVACVVDPAYRGPALFGLRFFIDNHLALTLNPREQVLAIRGEGGPQSAYAGGSDFR